MRVVAIALGRSIEHWSFIPDHMSPGQQAASEGGQADMWISHWLLLGGGYMDQRGHG